MQKHTKFEKNVCVLVILTNFGKAMTDKFLKNSCKNAYLGSIFIPEKYVFRVCFESPFTRMISSLKYKWSPGDRCIFVSSHYMVYAICYLFLAVNALVCFDIKKKTQDEIK